MFLALLKPKKIIVECNRQFMTFMNQQILIRGVSDGEANQENRGDEDLNHNLLAAIY